MLIYTIGFAVSVGFMLTATKIVDLLIKAPGYRGRPSNHFDGKRFHNLNKIKGRSLLDVLKWCLTKDEMPWKERETKQGFRGPKPKPRVDDGSVSVTFVNHATFLIQAGGLNILTDPVWSKRASPFQWIGPKRMRPPGIRFEDLPQIDAVLISHNHYDHLDIHTVRKLHEQFDPLFVVPLGVAGWLSEHGIQKTAELDWWGSHNLDTDMSVTAVPAQHFSGRGLSDRDRTLWCGYVLESPSGSVYFAGDTAYDDFFREIGDTFAIDLAFIPIGAYKPRWFMTPIHADPGEAVRIHQDVGAKTSIGMHFGTFPLADEGRFEPVRDLQAAKNRAGLTHDDFTVLNEGERRAFRFSKVLSESRAV